MPARAREVTLVAHDWGAVIAWYFAIRQVRPLKKLIICNVPHPQAMQQKFNLAQLKKSWYIFFFQIPGLAEFLMSRNNGAALGGMMRSSAVDKRHFGDEVGEGLSSQCNATRCAHGGWSIITGLWFAVVAPSVSVRSDFRKSKRQRSWSGGEDDVALTKETTYGTDQYVRHLTMRYLPRVSHWVQQEQPEIVNAMMKAFLADEAVAATTMACGN